MLALSALVHNVFLLPRYARILWRDEDRRRGYSAGVVAYSVALVVLTIVFFGRPDVVAGAWGILAFGDGLSSVAGRLLGGPRLPWNPTKTWGGSIVFVLAGGIACALLVADAREHAPASSRSAVPVATVAGAGALAGAGVESLRAALDDNISTTLAAAIVLFAVGSFDADAWDRARSAVAARAGPALVASLGLGAIAVALGGVGRRGLVAGVVLAGVIGAFGGPGAFAALVVFVVSGMVATRVGRSRKSKLGIVQEVGGTRGAEHALAKLLVPAGAAVMACTTPFREPALLAAVAAMAAAAGDTLATEIGPLFKGTPRFLPSLRRVAPGAPGGVTLEGTVALGMGALAVGLAAWGGGAVRGGGDLAWVVLVATFAGVMESMAGAGLVPRGLVGRGTMNLLMTAFAAWLATLR